MMPEGNETPGGDPPGTREGPLTPLGRSEGDLLAERRARRAVEGGEAALTRRAEAAEATVHTLERHVASLQQRLREAEEEQSRLEELLEIERASALAGEDELRRVKQREYAEQQLRVEAEERLEGQEGGGGAENELIDRRLADSERVARELAERLSLLQRQLSESEQAAAAERAALARAEVDLRARVEELERRTAELARALDVERAARERSEALLESVRQGHGRVETLLGEIRGLIRRLAAALGASGATADEPGGQTLAPQAVSPESLPPQTLPQQGLPPQELPPQELPPQEPSPQELPPQQPRAEGLPGETFPPQPPTPGAPTPPPPATVAEQALAQAGGAPPAPARSERERPGDSEMADALAAAVERLRARAEMAGAVEQPGAPGLPAREPHKHSMSGIARWRKRRKQRVGDPGGRRADS